ncbi:phage baseplate assembly protein W [Clostridium aceticum]|uniref:Phage baseplate assembly protein W n=1 Tax=Clostridium aceticum TaxID=84022 RepID=A0A0D8ICW2_9CLOT|nr:GPW/gp25 family protein [Clostridium aceticum]AKL95023.1 phage baseplate assembly protein W [Clostridium aceticum]KJF27919.1 hypothetical protein TZ02_04925 [Clostridium aceticum]
MIDLFAVEFISPDNAAEEVIRNLRVLFTTPQGTVPFDRGFGVDFSIVDEPVNLARGKITVEYVRKAQRYEPRAKVTEVFFEYKENKLIPRVKVRVDAID